MFLTITPLPNLSKNPTYPQTQLSRRPNGNENGIPLENTKPSVACDVLEKMMVLPRVSGGIFREEAGHVAILRPAFST